MHGLRKRRLPFNGHEMNWSRRARSENSLGADYGARPSYRASSRGDAARVSGIARAENKGREGSNVCAKHGPRERPFASGKQEAR
jgi:hypothetical protein